MSESSSRLAISTMSLGRAWLHKLAPKLAAASFHGYSGIELFFEDLEYHARDMFQGTEATHLLQAAVHIHDLCVQYQLEVVCLQPLMHFEGRLDPAARAANFSKARLWFLIANILETDIIAVPSSFLSAQETSGDLAVLTKDLGDLADFAAGYGIRLVYEALCWGTHVDRWEQTWEVVKAVDRANFGICLDTFNIAGRIWADPTADSGCTQDAEEALSVSLRRMSETIDPKKVFYIQVVDAERLSSPINPHHEFYDASQPARMSWSRNCRLFYGEQDRGGYLPIHRIMQTIVQEVGFRGWMSMELFNRSMANPDASTPDQHAERGAIAWKKLQTDFNLVTTTGQIQSPKADEMSRPRAVL